MTTEFDWDGAYALLLEWMQSHNANIPPKDLIVDGFRLGAWADRQHRSQRTKSLNRRQSAQLNALPGWTALPFEEAFQKSAEQCAQWMASHGHILPAKDLDKPKTAYGLSLGAWVQGQLAAHCDGYLSARHAAALEKIPGWTWQYSRRRWESNRVALTSWMAEHDNTVPRSNVITADGFTVGQWVLQIRHRHSKGKLPEDEVRALESIPGWTWDPFQARYDAKVRLLRQWMARNGGTVPHPDVTVDGFTLGVWAVTQQGLRRAGELPTDRIAALDAIPGWEWDTAGRAKSSDTVGLKELRRWLQVHDGKLPPPSTPLGKWAAEQRRRHRRGELSKYRVDALTDLPGWHW